MINSKHVINYFCIFSICKDSRGIIWMAQDTFEKLDMDI